MTTVIRQIVGGDTQTIRQVVSSNDRGPQGEQGIPGGTIQYSAGAGINISEDNKISATGKTSVDWGLIEGTLSDQTDLQTALNAKANSNSLSTVAITGAYSDLSGKPTIPTVNNATLTVTQNGISKGTFTANASSNATIALTDTTYADFVGASAGVAGTAGLVPAPGINETTKFLKSDGTWGIPLSTVETSNTASIILGAGKWLVIHSTAFHQTSATSAAIYSYNLGNADNSAVTWATPPATGQEAYAYITRFAVVTLGAQTTCTRTATSTTNVTISSDKWVAIQIA